MKTIQLQVGDLGTNCFIVYCEITKEAAVIDPGGSAAAIWQTIAEHQLTVTAIINTHGHADHIGANTEIKEKTKAALYIHADDSQMLVDARLNLSAFIGKPIVSVAADHLLKEGDVLSIGQFTLEVIHTPGHTPGGICLKADDVIFAGDTLFSESVGRTDFPGGSMSQLITNIKTKLMCLSDSYKVYAGHGPETTIGWERKMNSFLQ